MDFLYVIVCDRVVLTVDTSSSAKSSIHNGDSPIQLLLHKSQIVDQKTAIPIGIVNSNRYCKNKIQSVLKTTYNWSNRATPLNVSFVNTRCGLFAKALTRC